MNRLLIASILALLSWGVSAQAWTYSDQSFEHVYQGNTSYLWDDSLWVYNSGNIYDMKIVYNVDLLLSPISSEMLRGVLLLDAKTDRILFFLNYIGDLSREEIEGVEYQTYEVDVLDYDVELSSWEYLSRGVFAMTAGKSTLIWSGVRIDYSNIAN